MIPSTLAKICNLMSIYLMSMQLVYLLSRYAQLSLGKYSVLREVDFVRRASQKHPQLQYLYLGYYIPNNEKMMYKVRLPHYLYLVAAKRSGCRYSLVVQACRAWPLCQSMLCMMANPCWCHGMVQLLSSVAIIRL